VDLSRTIYRSPIFKAAAGTAMDLYRSALFGRGLDDTWRSSRTPALVLAPHPDDETLGCGATILRKRAAGTPVRVVVVTDGGGSHRSAVLSVMDLKEIRRREAIAACAQLGVAGDRVQFLGYSDGSLADQVDRLTQDVLSLAADFGPGEILAPSGMDGHPDHRALNRAVRRAIHLMDNPIPILEYPVWFWDARSWVDFDASALAKIGQLIHRPLALLGRCRPRVVPTGPFLARKQAAVAAYRSQLCNITGEPGWPVLDPVFLRCFLGQQEIFFPSEQPS
jgi:LmbE family N-acetylglucosaminyl deacetylase